MAKTKKAAPAKKEEVAEVAAVSDAENSGQEDTKPKKRGRPANPNGVQKAKNMTAKPKAKPKVITGTGETVAKAKAKAKPDAKAAKPKPAAKAAAPSKNPSIGEMTTDALKKLKDRKGHSMTAIRKFISTEYERKDTTQLRNAIRKFMEEEFNEGRIRMTNFEGDAINFSKRFALVK